MSTSNLQSPQDHRSAHVQHCRSISEKLHETFSLSWKLNDQFSRFGEEEKLSGLLNTGAKKKGRRRRKEKKQKGAKTPTHEKLCEFLKKHLVCALLCTKVTFYQLSARKERPKRTSKNKPGSASAVCNIDSCVAAALFVLFFFCCWQEPPVDFIWDFWEGVAPFVSCYATDKMNSPKLIKIFNFE